MPLRLLREMKNKKLRNDIILIIIPLVICAGIFGWRVAARQDGEYVCVKQNNTVLGEYPLDKDTEIRFDSENGGYNILVISEGKAEILSASCKDKICVNHRKICYEGESIVCLPNRLMITVESTEKTADLVP
jgi:hypothetical protein